MARAMFDLAHIIDMDAYMPPNVKEELHLVETIILQLEVENARMRKTLQQVLVDAQSQDVLSEWWTAIELALTPNVELRGAPK